MTEVVGPHLLPLDHPVKEALDQIFSKSRVTENSKTFSQAGFEIFYSKNKITMARHKQLPGYLVKVYLDTEEPSSHKPSWYRLAQRCIGADNIRKLIIKEKIVHFTVPTKWLYLLPFSDQTKHPVILLAVDMEIDMSGSPWKEKITEEHLRELHCLLSHGYGSTYLDQNVPFTKGGQFAFIDTEYAKRHLNLDKVKHYLSPEMALYWESLVKGQ